MKRITANEFYAMIQKNPSVFEHWDTPLEITEYTDCGASPITHLSKHLLFSGKKESGNAASFRGCPNLKIATGTFHGCVWFSGARIETIENLHVTQKNEEEKAVSFYNCKYLKVATGTNPQPR
jgi:hypothetical protein